MKEVLLLHNITSLWKGIMGSLHNFFHKLIKFIPKYVINNDIVQTSIILLLLSLVILTKFVTK